MADKPLTGPLPADLPEDWQYNQIVAPTGADVGLSVQHGYNYLMEQVNVVQEGVNKINEAFARLATLGINGKIPIEQLVIDTALSVTSDNPVQNKIVQQAIASINQALAGKAASNHGHTLASLGAAAANHSHTAAQVGAAAAGHGHSLASLGAAAANHGHDIASLGGCRIVTGIYTGNDSKRQATTNYQIATLTGGQFINLGAKPKFVMISIFSNQPNYANVSGWICGSSTGVFSTSDMRQFTESNNWSLSTGGIVGEQREGVMIDIVDRGFYVGNTITNGYSQNTTNSSGNKYAYVAII